MTVKRHRSAGAREIGGLDVVAALRHGRCVARLSQRDLARRAGVSQSMIARIESRRVDPPVGLVQHLLSQCGLRWELRLAPCGATAQRAATGAVAVRKSAHSRAYAAGDRRMKEHAAARGAGEKAAAAWLSVRQRRAAVRAARLAERAAQAAAFAELVANDDAQMREWLAADGVVEQRLFRRCMDELSVPAPDRLPRRLAGPALAGEMRRLLDTISTFWVDPPVVLTGVAARAMWSAAPARRSTIALDVAPVRDRAHAVSFLMAAGASARAGGEMFDLHGLTIRLRRSPPSTATLIRWRSGQGAKAIAVARPESVPGAVVDRHAVRAVMAAARLDSRGRRYAPYHETLGVAVRPLWFESA